MAVSSDLFQETVCATAIAGDIDLAYTFHPPFTIDVATQRTGDTAVVRNYDITGQPYLAPQQTYLFPSGLGNESSGADYHVPIDYTVSGVNFQANATTVTSFSDINITTSATLQTPANYINGFALTSEAVADVTQNFANVTSADGGALFHLSGNLLDSNINLRKGIIRLTYHASGYTFEPHCERVLS